MVVVIVNPIMLQVAAIPVYAKVELLNLIHVHFHRVKFSLFYNHIIQLFDFILACPIKDCGTQGICVETDGLIPKGATKPIYYVCLCQKGYISAGSCDGKIDK